MKYIMTFILALSICQTMACPKDAFGPSRTVREQKLILNGIGMRLAYFIKIKAYAAGLYMTQKSQDPKMIQSMKGPKIIDLYFLRDLGKGKLTAAWSNKKYGLKKTFPKELNTLNSYMSDVKKNSHGLILEFDENGLVVTVMKETKPRIYNPDFARAILNIFIGQNPPNKELKEGLLGLKACEN